MRVMRMGGSSLFFGIVMGVAAVMADEKNLLVNPGMQGAALETGLPAGWQKMMVPGLETICDFSLSEGPAGKPAIALEWKQGGPRFGVEPELKSLEPSGNGFEFSTMTKTSGSSDSTLIAVALDKDGKTVAEWKSSPLRSPDWKKNTLLFRVPDGTAKIKVSCFNEGQGTVFYSSAQLKKTDGAAIETVFPMQAICMPAEIMKELNGGNAEFNTFVDRPCPLAFEFKGKAPGGKTNSFVIELPKGIRIQECFNAHSNLRQEEIPEIEQIQRDGLDYCRHTFKQPKVFTILQPSWAWGRMVVMALLPDTPQFAGSRHRVYWHMESGDAKSPEASFVLNILPAMPKTPNPKNFPCVLWGMHDMDFNRPDVFAKTAELYEEAGMNFRLARGTGPKAAKDAILEKRGWAMSAVVSDYTHSRWVVDCGGWEKIKDKLEYCVREDGKTDKDRICPQYIIKDSAFISCLRDTIAGALGKCGLKNGEAVYLDIEPWEPMEWCYCMRCRQDFADYCKLDKTPEITAIKAKHRKDWRDFRCLNTAEVIRLHAEAIKATYPDAKIRDYDYVVNFNQPEFRNAYTRVAKDPQLNEKHFDTHVSSYYHYLDKEAFDMIEVNAKNLAKEYWVLGAIDRSGSYLNAKEVISPAQARMLILAAAASGGKGAGFYPGLHIDGTFFIAIDRAMAEIAVLEDFFMKGKRSEDKIRVDPLPYFAKKIQAGGKEIEIVRPQWKDFFGHRGHDLEGGRLVSLFNYAPDKKAFVKVSTQMPEGKYTVLEPISGKRFVPRAGKDFWDAAEVAGGFICDVPARDVRFLVVRPFAEKDSSIPLWGSSEDFLKEFEKEKKAFADVPCLIEPVKRDGMEIACDDINKDGQLEVTLASPGQKLWINTECGGVLAEWKVDGRSTCMPQLAVPANLKSMCWDLFWLPNDLRWNGAESAPVKVEKAAIENGRAILTMVNALKKAPLELWKTYEISAAGTGFTLVYTIKNKGREPLSFSFWSHNFPKLAGGKLDERMSVFLPLKDGLKEINKEKGSFTFPVTEGEHPGFSPKDIAGILTGNRFGVWAHDGNYGIIAEVEKSKLMMTYLWWNSQPTVEWMYKETTLPPGGEWRTEIKYTLIDKTERDVFVKKLE